MPPGGLAIQGVHYKWWVPVIASIAAAVIGAGVTWGASIGATQAERSEVIVHLREEVSSLKAQVSDLTVLETENHQILLKLLERH